MILASPPEKVVRSDFKIYEEEGIRYAVSQVEELGFGNFWQHAKPLAGAVQDLCDEERLAFAALDNLVKGAAGQAVQCMNIRLGLPEAQGLDHRAADEA